MKALLVRIGVDQTYGGWNAPVDPDTLEFVYVPIPEAPDVPLRPALATTYDRVLPQLEAFAATHEVGLHLPSGLADRPTHHDPDFDTLTYGDHGDRRGAGLRRMVAGDVVAFYAGLRPVKPCEHRLLYALIGLYVVDEVVRARDVPAERWHENAHTRRACPGPDEIVVRARPGASGLLERCLPIGEWRDRSYRVRRELLEAWGGLSVKDGYLQRSGVPPRFLEPERFLAWFGEQRPTLIKPG